MARENQTFRLRPEILEALRKAAEKDGRSIAQYTERVLIEHLKQAGVLDLKQRAA